MTDNCTDANQNQTNMRLKCAKTITINGKDVQRIKILNDVVWEKTKETILGLSATPTSVTIGKTFSLVAEIQDTNGNSIDGNIIFSGNGISGSKTIRTTNGIAMLQKITPTNTGTKNKQIYTAKFVPTDDVYLPSTQTVEINVEKEKPILKIVGETTIYNSWKIGVKLTGSDGKTLLTDKTITVSGAISKTITTNSKGIASLTVNGLSIGKKNITFTYAGNSRYEKATKSQPYTVKKSTSMELDYNGCNLGKESVSKGTQKWKLNNSDGTSYQCRETGVTCYTNKVTIASSSGTRKTPDLLKISFKKNSISKITGAIFTFNSQSIGNACEGSGQGGLFKSAPTVKLSVNGSSYHKGKGAIKFDDPINLGWGDYTPHTVVPQKITWDDSYAVSANPIISIQYPSNAGGEEACLKVYSVKLQVSYIPKQKTSFS